MARGWAKHWNDADLEFGIFVEYRCKDSRPTTGELSTAHQPNPSVKKNSLLPKYFAQPGTHLSKHI